MKRLIPLLLAMLLLCGCAAEPEPSEPSSPTTQYVEPTEPSGSYAPGSEAELASSGAVRAYPMTQTDAYALAVSGDDVLLFSGTDQTLLTLMTGENLYTVAQTALDIMVHPGDPSFRITENGITYFDSTDGSIVFLDQDLHEVSRKQTPETMTGSPILSENRMKLYYCTADAIRVLDLETGIDRLLKEISYPKQRLEGVLFGDTVLHCCIQDMGKEEHLFISAQTGELLFQKENELTFAAGEDSFFVQFPEGILQLSLFGKVGEEPRSLNPTDPFANVQYLDSVNGALTCSGSAGSLTLDYYDLNTGLRSASVCLPDTDALTSMDAGEAGGLIYLLARNASGDGCTLFRWEISRSATNDQTVYASARYTLEDPDVNGLALCSDRAYGLSQTYGVEVLVGMDAVANEPWDYELYPEYQIPVVNRMLEQLEAVLQTYPDGFFKTLSEKTTGLPVKICLVRSLCGSPESGSLEIANGIQFWIGDEPYVVLAAGEWFSQTFYHEMFHVLETCVYGHSNAYDDWDQLNPAGFAYDYDYVENQDRVQEEYLNDENRSFIDTYSMSYPKEDRARIMEYACVAGNEHYFTSDTMQKKLKVLCSGIREAFDLREYPNGLPWEQYLKEPLTP